MKPKILLIEDDRSSIAIYEKILEKAGFNVKTLMSGKEGLEVMAKIKEGKKEKPALVLLDLILPDINGIKILEEAKKEKETKDIHFMILTNYIDPEIKEMGEKLGTEYIVKTNVAPKELIKKINKHLRNKHP
jgi:DNA-binding response OmpR family regulator